MNADIQQMILRPGRYAISSPSGLAAGLYVMVEVEEDGTVYQLDPAYRRDGVLLADGWMPDTRCYFVNDNETLFIRISDPKDVIVGSGR